MTEFDFKAKVSLLHMQPSHEIEVAEIEGCRVLISQKTATEVNQVELTKHQVLYVIAALNDFIRAN